MLNSIGTELKVIRIRNELRLEDVADKLQLNRETLRRYENDANGLSVERLEQLLNFYNVDKSIFFKNVCANIHDKVNNPLEEEE